MLIFLVPVSENYGTTLPVTSASDIAAAMKIAQPGDTLLMNRGVWTDQHIVFEGVGEEIQPIVLLAAEPGFVILNGTSTLRISGRYLEVNGLHFVGGYSRTGGVIEFRNGSSKPAHHCRLTQSAVIDYNPTSNSTEYKWLSLYGTHNRVDYCYFEGKKHGGATFVVWLDGDPNYHQVDHNYFGFRPELGVNGGETIRVGTSDWSLTDSYTTVEYNYFEQCNGETEIISSKSCENIYRYNTFFDCEGTLTLRHGNRCTVEGNYFLGNNNYDAGGVRIIGEDHRVFNNYFYELNGSGYRSALCMVLGVVNSPLNRYYQVKRASVAFNTFVDCRNSITIGYGSSDDQSLTPLDCKIANNIAVSDDDIFEYETDPVNMVVEGNFLWGDPGIDLPDGNQLADPLLEQGEDTLWRLTAGSPAIDAGVGSYDYLTHDMDGQPRMGGLDAGADEYSSEPIGRRPPGPESTGPGWLNNVAIPLLLTLQKEGSGQVIVDPPGGIYEDGTVVTLSALPDSGWRFVRWTGDVESTTNPLSLLMEDNRTVRAIFEEDGPVEYTVNVYVFSGGGSVEMDPPGPVYQEGTEITMTAIPENGWEFIGWGGHLTGEQNPVTVLVDSNKSLTATFKKATNLIFTNDMPVDFELAQNYPNPFNPSTEISYTIPKPAHVRLMVYNSLGQHVVTLINMEQSFGKYQVRWNGRSSQGDPVDSGWYLYRLTAGDYAETKKMLLVR